MSFSSRSSRSSNGRHYRNGNNGSNHYQKKGFIGNLFNMMGSRSGSDDNYRNQYTNTPNNNQPIVNEPVANQNVLICSKCNSEIPTGSKFCLQCGQKVNAVLHCMDCGEKILTNAKFCPSCGKKISE